MPPRQLRLHTLRLSALPFFRSLLGVANVAVMRLFSRSRKDENRQLRREQALLFGIGTSGLRNMESLRATATEDDFFARWSGYQAREVNWRQTALFDTRRAIRKRDLLNKLSFGLLWR